MVLFHVERCFKIKETAKHTFDRFLTLMNLSNVCFAVLFHVERCFKTKETAKHTFDRFLTIMNLSNVLTLFQLGSGVTLPTGGGHLVPGSVLSVIKPLKDY